MKKTNFNREEYEYLKAETRRVGTERSVEDSGKGCVYRLVDKTRYDRNYDRIFGKKKRTGDP